MGRVSIDLDQMQGVVDGLNSVIREVPGAAASVVSALDQVWLDYPGLSRWTAGGQAIWRLTQLVQECQRRLDMARQIAAATPGSTLRVISFDDAPFVNQDARRAQALIESGQAAAGQIPEELLDLLAEYGDDPEFAAALAGLLPADRVAAFLGGLNGARDRVQFDVVAGGAPASALDEFDQRYNRLLDGLAGTLSLAARGMGADRLRVFTRQYQDVFAAGARDGRPDPLVLSLLIGRGAWPDGFLNGVAASILDSGGQAGGWGGLAGVQVVDPRRDPDLDGRPVVTDPMVGVFQSAATFSPWWMASFFSGNGSAGVDLPGYRYDDGVVADPLTVQVDWRVEQVMLDYGMDQDSAYWFGQAAAATAAWGLACNGAAPGFAADVAAVAAYWQRQQVIEDHKSWWDKHKHDVMMGLGVVIAIAAMAAGPLAAPWAAGALLAADLGVAVVDAGMYFRDGDWRDGLVTLGFLLLPVAAGGVVRWVRLSRAEVEAVRAGGTISREGVTVDRDLLAAWGAAGRGAGAADPVVPGVTRRTVPTGEAPNPYTAADVDLAWATAPRDGAGRAVDWRTGEPLRAPGPDGERAWYMQWDPDNGRWVAQNPGAGHEMPEAGLPAKGVPNSYGYDEFGDRLPFANHRPEHTEEEIEAVWNQAKQKSGGQYDQPDGSQFSFDAGDVVVQDIDGRWYKVEWEPGQPRNWDMGHIERAKYSKLREAYLNHEIDTKTFLSRYHNPENYRVEDPLRNSSHIDE